MKALKFLVAVIGLIVLSTVVFATNCGDYKTELTCTAANCKWRTDPFGGSWCEELDCWSFWNSDECNAANVTYGLACYWKQSSMQMGWCNEISCWMFEGNQTACTDVAPNYGLNCEWEANVCSGPPQCTDPKIINNQTACNQTTVCKWGSCNEKGCWAYSDSSSCNADSRCSWNSNCNCCNEVGCWDLKHNTQAACNNQSDLLNCIWNSQYNYCEELGCWKFNQNQTGCLDSDAHPGVTCTYNSDGGWCNDLGCPQYNTQSECAGKTGYKGKNCSWFIETGSSGWCEKRGCWNFDNMSMNGLGNESHCENYSQNFGLNCIWEENPWCPMGGCCYQNVSALSCTDITDQKRCVDTMYCFWDFQDVQCEEPQGGDMGGAIGGDFKAPDCSIFSTNETICNRTIGCGYNGAQARCNTLNPSIYDKGLNCSLINDSSYCGKIPFLPHCCEWMGSSCVENKMTKACWDNMDDPPTGAMYCEDYNAYTSKTLCNQIANYPWFMPCAWNNATSRCGFNAGTFFKEGQQRDIDLVDNKEVCEKGMGGIWTTESYCGSGEYANISISIGRCAAKLGTQSGNCDTACFNCNYKNDGTNHSSLAAAKKACADSKVGFCEFREKSSAPNGYGFCEPSSAFKSGAMSQCDSANCESCNQYNSENARTKCLEVNCQWTIDPLDPTKGFCHSANSMTCFDKCSECKDKETCTTKGRGQQGACSWDDNGGYCKNPSSGGDSGTEEICFNGIDDDGDGNVDCADNGCFSDSFCGGDFLANCFIYNNNETCSNDTSCAWMTDSYGGWCDMKAAQCWMNDGDEEGCNAMTDTCAWHEDLFGGGICDINKSIMDVCQQLQNETVCNSQNEICKWFPDMWCLEHPEDSWCAQQLAQNKTPGWCGHKYNVCFNNMSMSQDQQACEAADTTVGVDCVWKYDPFMGGGHCEPPCMGYPPEACVLDPLCEMKT
ncbi:hypothetical protein JXA85_00780, partial [Candidatus Woesearchaeota archaeon]|nr:hypothetical protein [Candidatus Woesearchaeota archaeon]